MLSVWPATWTLISSFATSDSATPLRMVWDSGVSVALPVSKFTPSRMSVFFLRLEEHLAAFGVHLHAGRRAGAAVVVVVDAVAVAVLRQRAALGVHLLARRRVGARVGVVGHAVAVGVALAGGAAVRVHLLAGGVLAHVSVGSATPSPSASLGSGQPLASTCSPAGVSAH